MPSNLFVIVSVFLSPENSMPRSSSVDYSHMRALYVIVLWDAINLSRIVERACPGHSRV